MKTREDYERWIAKQDNVEDLAKWVKKDLVLYVSEERLDWDYPDVIMDRFVEDFEEELTVYFLDNGEYK